MMFRTAHGRLRVQNVLLKRGLSNGKVPTTKSASGWIGKVSKIGVAVGTGIIAAGNFVEGNLEFLDNILTSGKGVAEEVEKVAETVEHVVEESKVVVEEVEAVVEEVKEVEDTVKKDLDESIEVVKEVTEVEKEVVEVIEEAGAIVEETEDLVEAVEQAAEEGVSVFQALSGLAFKISKLWHLILCLLISSHLLFLHYKKP